ncbi:MAG: hypothetical protein Q9162_005336 [Coniocarpon cinnabarinum]
MTNFTITARVQSGRDDQDAVGELSDGLEELFGFLFESQSAFAESPRPAKKRRIEGTKSAVGSGLKSDGPDDICVAEVTIDMVHNQAESGDRSYDASILQEATVAPLSHEYPDGGDGIVIDIGRQGDLSSGSVAVVLSTKDAEQLNIHLQHLIPLPVSRPPMNNSPPSFHMWTSSRFLQREDGSYGLKIKIWCNTLDVPYQKSRAARGDVYDALRHFCQPSKESLANTTSSTAQLFYEVVHTPDPTMKPPPAIQHPLLRTGMFPFQKRAVTWLLERERVRICDDGAVSDVSGVQHSTPLSYHEFFDSDGRPFYVSRLLGHVIRNPCAANSLHRHLHGGILSEEMGLGKTVELIDLVNLHPRTANLGESTMDAYSNERVKISSATLVVSPPAILDQWISEIRSHAPDMKVFHYKGVKQSEDRIMDTLREQDIVVTTYQVLASEIHYANEKPQRNMRHQKKYVQRRSPLVKILWWRVCLDEAQMIESGVSSAATVARRIPRCNAWAVTGTPLKKDIKDLLGLLIFLRFEPFCDSTVWKSMEQHPGVFSHIFSSIAMRHTKAQVRTELQLPPQKRVVVTLPFTAIEEQHYKQLFDEMCAEIGLDRKGAPMHEYWDPESESTVSRMRQWLTRLRQTCLHPEVGERNKRALGRSGGALRTVEEVLQVMIEQNETSLRSVERGAISAKLTQGHLLLFAQCVDKEKALNLYLQALQIASEAVVECREQMQEEAKRLGEEVDGLKTSELDADERRSERLSAHRNRLRNALELEHASAFFVATAYYQMKMQKTDGNEDSTEYQEFEKLEIDYYDHARGVRKEMLRDIATSTQKLIADVRKTTDAKKHSSSLFPSSSNHGGIESQKVFRAIDSISSLINRQSRQLQEWRSKLAGLLSESLLDQEEVELTGDEYDATLKNQDEQYVYLFVLRALVAQRHETLNGQVNALVYHEIKEALKQAKEGEGHDPELMKSALETCSLLAPARGEMLPVPNYVPPNEQSVTGSVVDMRAMITSLRFNEGTRGSTRAANEASMLEGELKRLQQASKEQTEALKAHEKDVDLYRSTMNSRLEYYRQLQAISDTVRPYQEHESEALDFKKLKQEQTTEQRQADKARVLRTKRKFLHHLQHQKDGRDERRPCIICLQPFEVGVLTVCAHEFCKDCISIWMSDHKTCPMCKKPLRLTDLHNVTYKPREMQAQEERQSASPSSSDLSDDSSRSSIYSNISEEALNDIKAIDLPTSYSSKLDTIARHLLYLRANEPGVKTVLFSQYRDFLGVLGRTLRRCKISFTEIQSKNGIRSFKEDPNVECFLLHAKADSSGLNLVNATHVILCEPLINTAVELQAISRVHRIGQRRATTVWMYVVADSVEEAIYEISVDRRLRLMGGKSGRVSTEPSRAGTPALESRLDAVNSIELQSAPLSKLMTPGASGGEIVANDDLWSCLFGKAKDESSEETTREMEETIGRHLRAEAADSRLVNGQGQSSQ